MPFETFAHARTLTLPLPLPNLSPPPLPIPPIKKENCQIRIPCQFIEKSPPPHQKEKKKEIRILCQKIHLPLPPSPRPAQTTHTSPPHPAQFFSDLDILIICQLDSVLVNFFYKLTIQICTPDPPRLHTLPPFFSDLDYLST